MKPKICYINITRSESSLGRAETTVYVSRTWEADPNAKIYRSLPFRGNSPISQASINRARRALKILKARKD